MIDYSDDEVDFDDYENLLDNTDAVNHKLSLIVDGLLKHPEVTRRNWAVEFTGWGSTNPRFRLQLTRPDWQPDANTVALDSVPIEMPVDRAVTKFASHVGSTYRIDPDGITIGQIDASRIVSNSITTFSVRRGGIQYPAIPTDLSRPQGINDRLRW